jgi:hypothetical protein
MTPITQEQQVRTIILIPSAMPGPAQESLPPKAAKAPSRPPTAREGIEAIEGKEFTPEKIEHLRTLPMLFKRIQEGEAPGDSSDPTARREHRPPGTISHNPSKLPAGIAGSALVLGPANELLESKRAAAQMEPSATIEDKVTKGTSAGTSTREKALPAKTSPYFEKWLKDYIQTACGEEADGLAVALDSGNRLQVRFRVKNDANGERIGRKIIALPELARYQVSFDIDVLP